MNATPGRTPAFLAIAAGAMLIACSAAAFAEPAGRVLFVAGDVILTDATGNIRALERGASVEEGDTIATHDGRVQVQFKDGAFLALQPETRFRVERYRYTAAGDAEDGVVMSLIKGGLRTISGLVGKKNRDDYRMESAVATIGIRGTDYALELNTALSGHVAEGAIEVCNGGGCSLVQSGFAFSVPSFMERPVLGERRAFLPPTQAEPVRAGSANDRDDGRAHEGHEQVSIEDRESKQFGKAEELLPAPGAASIGTLDIAPTVAAPGLTQAGNGPGKSGSATAPRAPVVVPAIGTSTTAVPGNAGLDKQIPPGLVKKRSDPALDLTGPPGLVKKLP